MATESRSRPQAPSAITVTSTRLVTGSSHAQPVTTIASPAATTPAETTASPSMCWKALRMLRSPLRPEANSAAVTPFTTIPTAATIITVGPDTASGLASRCTASTPTATSSSTALASAARMEEDLRP